MNSAALSWLLALPPALSPVVYLLARLTRRRQAAWWAALAALAALWWPYVLLAQQLGAAPVPQVTIGAITLQADGLSLLLAGLALAAGTLVVLYSRPYLADEPGQDKYYALVLLMTGGIMGLACARDVFNLWVWFELMTMATWLLVAFYREQPASLEAAVKYLAQSAVGTLLVLLGIALVLLETGSLTPSAAAPSPVLLAAGGLFVVGFGVKAALVPLHTWLPDAHSQAPSGISALLSAVVIEAGLVALLRALALLPAAHVTWGALLMGAGALNMLFGNLMALRQAQIKRLLTYSSLSHVGYMLLGLGLAVYGGNAAAGQAGLFHMLTHGLMKSLAFLAAGTLLYALRLAHGDHHPLIVSDLSGAARRYPLAALALSLAVLGLGGLPPLAGFMSKWQIFVAGLQTRDLAVSALVVFAALNSVLSLGYYAPLVNRLYRQRMSRLVAQGRPAPSLLQAPLVVLALAVVAVGVWPPLLGWLTQPAGAALAAAFAP